MKALNHDAVISRLDVLRVPPLLEVKNHNGVSEFELSNADININSADDWGASNSILEAILETSIIEIQMQSGLRISIS